MRGANRERENTARGTASGFGLFAAALVLGIAAHARAEYSVTWSTMDGGGGTSTNGQYAVSGTIGQADAGSTLTNGPYSLAGGFWALPTAVQTTNAPMLIITPASPGNATLSWTPATPGFVLQERTSLSSGAWTNSPSGTNNPVTVPAVQPVRFYRLFKP